LNKHKWGAGIPEVVQGRKKEEGEMCDFVFNFVIEGQKCVFI